MQRQNRHQGASRTTVRIAIALFAPAFAAFVVAASTPSFANTIVTTEAVHPAMAVTTPWADAVRARLRLATVEAPRTDAADVGTTGVGDHIAAPVQGVTAWTRSVEAKLADHAHRVAQAGRAALAWSESGMASWYGGRHTGHRTANGDSFNPMQLTCAHPTLPLGTKVLVTSETTGRSVVVTVNDRGPYGGRIVDLSRAAAERIGMLGTGTANVTLEPASAEAVEVAEADASDTNAQALEAVDGTVNQVPRGQRHTRRDDR